MALVNVTLDCTGTGNSALKTDPSIIKSTSGTSVSKITKLPSRTLNTTGTLVGTILKVPGRILLTSATNDVIIFLIRFGIDTFDIIEVHRKWFITNVGKWETKAQKRFAFLVRGRPSG